MQYKLSLAHLEMLATIANCGTLAEAADTLRITPSALTHRIREAERRLGVRLFEKQGRILRPNAAAEILTATAERLLYDLQQSERVAIASVKGIRHVVRLSVAVYNAFHWLPDFLSWFRKIHPEIEIEIETEGAMNPFDPLSKGHVDLVMSSDMVLPGSLEAVHIFTDELVAVVPSDHRFAGRDHVTGRDFLDETFLTYSLLRKPGYEADRVWTPENVMPLREVNIGSVDAICALVNAGFGISILSHWGIEPQFKLGRLIPVRTTRTGLDIAWRAIFHSAAAPDAPERILARAMAEWFAANPPPGLRSVS